MALLADKEVDGLERPRLPAVVSLSPLHFWASAIERQPGLPLVVGTAMTQIVLVVEDDFLILEHVKSFVTSAGYTVLTANNADEAVLILEGRSDISIVFSDNDMPGTMNGLKLANAIRGRWPPIELILASGKVIPNIDLPARAVFFHKPYSEHEIIGAMNTFTVHAA